MRNPPVTEIVSNFPVGLMLGLRDHFNLKRFVETGTNRGDTTMMAAMAFGRVDTVEIDRERYAAACRSFASLGHVTCWLSESGAWFEEHASGLVEPTLFYLDAHGLEHSSQDVNFPLKRELSIIGGLHEKHCIVIDDNPPEAVLPLVSGWDCFAFGTDQFCVFTPGPCSWKQWNLDHPWYRS